MANFNYNEDKGRNISIEEISKTINKKVTLFGVRTDELSWALFAAIPWAAGMALLSFLIIFIAGIGKYYAIQDLGRLMLLLDFPFFIIMTVLHVVLLKRLNRRFGDGAALTALMTTSKSVMLLKPASAKKNFGFDVKPNNNYERIQ